MLSLTAIVSGFAAIVTFVGFCFRHLTIFTMEFYHTIRAALQSVVYFAYNSYYKSLFICVQKTIQQLHQKLYPLIC